MEKLATYLRLTKYVLKLLYAYRARIGRAVLAAPVYVLGGRLVLLGIRLRYLGLLIYRGKSAGGLNNYQGFGAIRRSIRVRLVGLLQRFLGKAVLSAIEAGDEEALLIRVDFSVRLGDASAVGNAIGAGISRASTNADWKRVDKLVRLAARLKLDDSQTNKTDTISATDGSREDNLGSDPKSSEPSFESGGSAEATDKSAPQDIASAASETLSQRALIELDKGNLDGAHKLSKLALELCDSPDNRFYKTLLTSLVDLKRQAEELAPLLRQKHENQTRNVFSAVVWGDEYIDYFMAYTVRSLLAAGNLPALSDQLATFAIMTTPGGAERIRAHPSFPALQANSTLAFFLFPDELTQRFHYSRPDFDFYRLYGALDHTAIHLARALEANIFFVVVDGVVSNNTLRTLRGYIEQGFDICANASIVSKRETFTPELDRRYGESGPIEINARDLANLGFEYRHDYISQRLVIASNTNFDKYPRELYFPTPDGLVVHALYQHPLVVSARAIGKDIKFDYFIVDSKLMARIFDDPRDFEKLKVIVDSDEAYVANFAPGSRAFDTTGRALDTNDFVAVHLQSEPIHHYIWKHRQLIRCDTDLRTHLDPEKVAVTLLDAIRKAQASAT